MGTRSEIYREIMKEYDRIRQKNQSEQRRKKALVYDKISRVAEIEQEMSLLGTKAARAVLTGGKETEELVEKMRSEQKHLEGERSRLMEENGFKKGFTDIEYDCEKCKDTGYIGQEQCRCFKNKLLDRLYNQSNVRDVIKVENFENFDIDLYGRQVVEEEGMSPRENARKLYRRATAFVNDFGKGDNLLLYGGTGLGKTFLCNCIAKELLDRGFGVLYLTAGQLFRRLEEQHFSRDEDDEGKEWDQELLEAELLIIDDLGTEFSTAFTASELFRIVNDRKLAKRSVIISTNLGPDELMKQYSDRIASRFFGEFEAMKFFGGDIRILKKYKKI